MDKSDIIALFEKYKKGACTEAEVQLLHEWLEQGNFDETEISEEEILKDLQYVKSLLPRGRSNSIYRWYRIAMYAASISLVVGIAYYFMQAGYLNAPQQVWPEENQIVLDPGSNKAVLRLNDGSSVVLDSLKGDGLLELDGALVRLNGKGQLVYLPQQDTETPKNNEIVTPRGGQYEVILSDGTQVWLNSDSKLSFTNSFDNLAERRVGLEGEAYFKVNHNADQPFVVSVQGQRVRVLGTEFNINAYTDNAYVKTSLVRGSVLFNQSRLKPGESALFRDNNIAIRQENMDDVIAWKNGYFVFFEESLKEAMEQIARWYDLEVSFADEETKSILFGGSISKYENASKVFRMIEKAGNVKITVKGRKVFINKAST